MRQRTGAFFYHVLQLSPQPLPQFHGIGKPLIPRQRMLRVYAHLPYGYFVLTDQLLPLFDASPVRPRQCLFGKTNFPSVPFIPLISLNGFVQGTTVLPSLMQRLYDGIQLPP